MPPISSRAELRMSPVVSELSLDVWVEREPTSLDRSRTHIHLLGGARCTEFPLGATPARVESQHPAPIARLVTVVHILKSSGYSAFESRGLSCLAYPPIRPFDCNRTQPQTLVARLYASTPRLRNLSTIQPPGSPWVLDLIKLPSIPNRDTMSTIAEPRRPLRHPDRHHG